MVASERRTVKFRGKPFFVLGDGWYAREVERPGGPLYRLHWGVTRLGCKDPSSMTVATTPGGDYLEFDSLEACEAHLARRGA